MVKLLDCDIQTREVTQWKGLHLFHGQTSSCSQKVRIFLNFKGVEWTSHLLDMLAKENLTPWYLGINPRGLVPVLVDNGDVHIESNDILLHLEERFPEPPLIPQGTRETVAQMLAFEDELHLDLRTLTARVMFPSDHRFKTDEDLERYRTASSGTVLGKRDPHIEREIEFWANFERSGISLEETRDSARRFQEALSDIDERLGRQRYILGESLSLLDIAWVVYSVRLGVVGYPVERLHPNLGAWLQDCLQRPEISSEVTPSPDMAAYARARREDLVGKGQSIEALCFS